MNRGVVRQVLPVVLALCLLGYVLKDVPLAALGRQFRLAHYGWLSAVGAMMGLFYVVRAARWQLILQTLHFRPSLFRTTVAILAGILASMIVPGAGELTRCGTLQRTDDVPLTQGIGSVIAERVIDLLMLLLLLVLTSLLEFKRIGQFMAGLLIPLVTRLTSGWWLLLLVSIGGLLAGSVWWVVRRGRQQQHGLMGRVMTIVRGMATGFLSIRTLKKPGLFVGLTLVSYLLAYLTAYCSLMASTNPTALPLSAALTILTVSSLGSLAVPTQTGLGTYHFLVSRVLLIYGLTETESVITATFMHAVQTGFSLLFSGLSFLIVPMLLARRKKERSVLAD